MEYDFWKRYPNEEWKGSESKEQLTLDSFAALAESQIKQPTNGDQRIAACAKATLDLINDPDYDRVRLSLGFMLDSRQEPDIINPLIKPGEPFTPLMAFNHWLRSLQHTILAWRNYPNLFEIPSRSFPIEGPLPRYPETFKSTRHWQREIRRIFNNLNARQILESNLVERRIQSNIANRERGVKLALLHKYADRFTNSIDVLDVGASLNLGLTKLMIQMPFSGVEVLNISSANEEGVSTISLSPNLELAVTLNELLDAPLPIRHGMGVDITPLDANSLDWVKSCSFYPSELLDEELVREFDTLALASTGLSPSKRLSKKLYSLHPQNLGFYHGDFSDDESMSNFLEQSPVEKFHVVTFLTIMHQLSDEERTAMLKRAKDYLHPDGLIIIQDFARVNPDSPNQLEFPPDWQPYLYRTIVIDPTKPNEGPRELLYWDWGRCEKVVLADE